MAKVAYTPEAVTFSSVAKAAPGVCCGSRRLAASQLPAWAGAYRAVPFYPCPRKRRACATGCICRMHHTGCMFSYASLPRRLCPTKVDASDSAPLLLARRAMC